MSEDKSNIQPSAASEAAVVSSKPPNDNHRDDNELKVKSEFLLSERPSCLASIIPLDNNSVDANNDNDGGDNNNNNKSSKKNNNKGQNKKRPRDKQIATTDKACLSIVRGETCPYQNSPKGCKYNHDLKEMLVNRPLDICDGDNGATWLKEEGCPFFRLRG